MVRESGKEWEEVGQRPGKSANGRVVVLEAVMVIIGSSVAVVVRREVDLMEISNGLALTEMAVED
jgi:hypothetical protein